MRYVLTILVIACTGAVAFLLCFLTALCRDKKGAFGCGECAKDRYGTSTRVKSQVVHFEPITGGRRVERHRKGWWAAVITMCACSMSLRAQSTGAGDPAPTVETVQAMQERINKLEIEVSELKAMVRQLQPSSQGSPTSADESTPSAGQQKFLQAEDQQTLEFLRDSTVSLGLDGYYSFNFNHPVGRVNLLRSYDILSNEFSLNQASVIFDHPPNVAAGRRWGGRLDLQFGQATDTLQGNPANEPRPQIYRNIFQAYGTYVIPIGKGVNLDFGKWSSSLGIEGNYTKDRRSTTRALIGSIFCPSTIWACGRVFR